MSDLILPITEQYRPSTIKDCILPDRIRIPLTKWKERPNTHLIFSGDAGTGKTTTALALAKDISPNSHVILNGSKDNDDNFINNVLSKMMTSVSLYGEKRIIIYDESDRLTEKAQQGLRKPLEDYAKVTTIIFTVNYPDKLLSPIKSRCFEFDFNLIGNEIDTAKSELVKRLKYICKKEKKSVPQKDLLYIANSHFPDIRKCLSILELY